MNAVAVAEIRNPELERLRCYLYEWAAWNRNHHPRLGLPESTLARFMKPSSPYASDLLEQSDSWAMMLLEAAMDDLLTQQNGTLMRAALRARYLSEGLDKTAMTIRCFRNGDVVEFSAEECDKLAERAEMSLIPLVLKRGLPL